MTDKAPQEIQSESWAGEMGDKWNTYLEQFESMIEDVGEVAVNAADFKAGERVLDVGCGGGATTFLISRKLGAEGLVEGLDLSPTLVDAANARSRALGLQNIMFTEGDAASRPLAGEAFDCVFSRFGVMFFEDPYAAFANLRTYLKPGGRLLMAVWGPPPANPWVFELMDLVRQYVEIPQPDPRAPGPFAFGDIEYVRDILAQAGFNNISFDEWKGQVYLGGKGADPASAADFLMDALFIGDVLQDQPETLRKEVKDRVIEILQSHYSDGNVALQGSVWLVKAEL